MIRYNGKSLVNLDLLMMTMVVTVAKFCSHLLKIFYFPILNYEAGGSLRHRI